MSKAPSSPILYDTSLRDGLQARGVNLSLAEKMQIFQFLAELEIPYIECGWPGANPKDTQFFEHLKTTDSGKSNIVAFGSTRKPKLRASLDPQILALKQANTKVVTLVAKYHAKQVDDVLKTTLDENLNMISESVSYFKDRGCEVIIDAEHFFDGFFYNESYTLDCLAQAKLAGADVVTLCDTNGGCMPEHITSVVKQLEGYDLKLGIHCHNDCELAVANSLAAWQAGATFIQGTINGVGERCGNANLTSLIPILQLKYGYTVIKESRLRDLSFYGKIFSDYYNTPLSPFAAFIGSAAFTHKGGLHASAVRKDSSTYEHIKPELVGNRRLIAISEQAGQVNIQEQAEKLGLNPEEAKTLLHKVKHLDQEGVDFEEADASLHLYAKRLFKKDTPAFEVLSLSSQVFHGHSNHHCQTTVKVKTASKEVLSVAEADGPVEALDLAFRRALEKDFPAIKDMILNNYKVRILDPQRAAAATTRVWIEAKYQDQTWCTVGCSRDILAASSQALQESFDYFITEVLQLNHSTERKSTNDNQAA